MRRDANSLEDAFKFLRRSYLHDHRVQRGANTGRTMILHVRCIQIYKLSKAHLGKENSLRGMNKPHLGKIMGLIKPLLEITNPTDSKNKSCLERVTTRSRSLNLRTFTDLCKFHQKL